MPPPDWYGDERRAARRVRVRHALHWAGLAACAAGLLWWHLGR